MEKVVEIEKDVTLKQADTVEISAYSRISVILGCFILFNAIKLTTFNHMIMPSKTLETFVYKAVFALLVNLIMYSLLFKIRSRIPLVILYAAQVVYIFANLSYFSYFKNYLHLFQASALFTEGVGPIEHFTIPVQPNMLIILIDLPFFIYAVVHYSKVIALNKKFKSYAKNILAVSLLILLSIEGWNYFNGCSIIQLNKDFFTSEPKIIERYGTIVNNISDITVNYGGENLIKHFSYGKTVSASAEVPDKPNIICIQVESMDSNIINQKYDGKLITPYLNSLTQEGIYYPYTLSYHKSGGTSDSEFSIINSTEPLGNYPSIKIPKYSYPNSFVKRMAEGNFFTAAFHGNIGNYYNRDVAFPKMGFKEFYDINKMGFEDAGWGAPDDKVFEYALNKMKNQGSPFFGYIITMSSHMPFTSVDDYYQNDSYDNIEEDVVKKYYKSLSYVDNSIKDFVQKAISDNPNTYVFIWGDHTPNISTTTYNQASYISEGDYFEFVPLFIITPDKKVYRESNIVASFLDISPTVLQVSGIKYSIKSAGMNLISPPAQKPKIPFKGNDYDRSELFEKISQVPTEAPE